MEHDLWSEEAEWRDGDFGFGDGRHSDADFETGAEEDSTSDGSRSESRHADPKRGLTAPTSGPGEIDFGDTGRDVAEEGGIGDFEPEFEAFEHFRFERGKFWEDETATLSAPTNGIHGRQAVSEKMDGVDAEFFLFEGFLKLGRFHVGREEGFAFRGRFGFFADRSRGGGGDFWERGWGGAEEH